MSPRDRKAVGLWAGALTALSLVLAPSISHAQTQTPDLVVRSALRVCADPANMPFSNKKKEGFENKIAELLGQKLGVPVLYTWFPQATGFIRQTLRARRCDLVIGYAQGHELVQNTNHYYRSAYAIVYAKDGGLDGLESLDDPRLKEKSIGVVAGTPPATVLALNGLLGKVRPYQLTVDTRYTSPAEDMIEDLAAGEIDAALLWGPMAGYYAKKTGGKSLAVVPLVKESKGPRMAFRITMGIRPREPDWKHQLNDLIAKHQDEINAILLDFGVPLLDEQDKPITGTGKAG